MYTKTEKQSCLWYLHDFFSILLEFQEKVLYVQYIFFYFRGEEKMTNVLNIAVFWYVFFEVAQSGSHLKLSGTTQKERPKYLAEPYLVLPIGFLDRMFSFTRKLFSNQITQSIE